MSPNKRTVAERVHDYLVEPDGEQFQRNKWRFWFIAVAFLSVVNSVLTWLIFREDAENYSGAILLSVGALTAWLCVCALHYTDSANRTLARSVSVIDSIALVAVVIHFAGLLYVYGHHRALRSAEARYEQQARAFNVEAKQVSADNVKIAEAAQNIAVENRKRARLESDAAFQLRRAAEAGRGIPLSRSQSAQAPQAALSTSAIELERPTKPAESSTAFLTKWDWLVRAANCAELLLAVLTLIVIRNVSAKSNSPTTRNELHNPYFASSRTPIPRPAFSTTQSDTVSRQNAEHNETTRNDTAALREGLKVLRETLRDIAFYTHGVHYKCDLKPDCVWIRQMTSDAGIQRTGHGAKARHSILRAARKMEPERFRAEVEEWLREHGFTV